MSDLVMPSSGHHTLSGLLMATPATLIGSTLTVAPSALGRVLVGAKTEERRLAQLAVRGPLGVCELRHELRPNPIGVTDRRWRVETGIGSPEAPQLFREPLAGPPGEGPAHPPPPTELRAVGPPRGER